MDDHLLLGPPVPPEQRPAESGERIQDRGETAARIPKRRSPRWPTSTTNWATRLAPRRFSVRCPIAARSAKLYSALGYTYEQQKQYKNAIEAYRHAIELDRDNLDAIRGLAQNLLNDGQTDAALEQYKVIADANPEDAQTYVRIAEIYRKQGKYDLALENLKKAESMVQDSVEVPYNIAAIYQAQGRYDEAFQIMKDLLKKVGEARQRLHPG